MSPMPFYSTDQARRLARRRLPGLVFDFVDGAAGGETAAALNRAALRAIRLQPRVLENVERRSPAKSLLGRDYGLPFGIAPMGMCNLVQPAADRMLADEAVRRDIPYCLSCAASSTLEEVLGRAGDRAWFQLYVGQSMELAKELVERAEAAGYGVLVLTVDCAQVARRPRDLKNGFQMPFRLGPRQVLDFARHPRWSLAQLTSGLPKPMNYETARSVKGFLRNESRGRADWGFLGWLRERWRGTLIVKGVMSGEDALRIRSLGVDGIWVSNHGGRQLDSAPPAVQGLTEIRRALGSNYPLIYDSGIRHGDEVVKALAMGADFVMLGRPLLYAIGAAGELGLASLLDFLEEDISTTLALIGVTDIEKVDSAVLPSPPHAVSGDPGCGDGLYEFETAMKG